ncbi:MAG: hypothetical protein NWR43_04555, partial [Alphaproteobacteria bacterium]|nr:hypothetical protein [Alphaproteobacteria bacterium]
YTEGLENNPNFTGNYPNLVVNPLKFHTKANSFTPENTPCLTWYHIIKSFRSNITRQSWPFLQGTNIRMLHVNDFEIGDEAALDLAFHLRGTPIRDLSLMGANISGKGALNLIEELESTNVDTLDLGINNFGPCDPLLIIRKISGKSKIVSLDISGNPIRKQDVATIASELQYTELKKLNISDDNLGIEGALSFVQNLRSELLTNLDFSGNKIAPNDPENPGDVENLGDSFGRTTVHTLSLASNQLGINGAVAFVRYLKPNKLKVLNLSNNNIGPNNLEYLAEPLKDKGLHTLSLARNGLGYEGALEFIKTLRPKALKCLDLSGNGIVSNDCYDFASQLVKSRLTAIFLRGNAIDSTFINQLSWYFHRMKLTEIDLSSNKIGLDGFLYIATNLNITQDSRKAKIRKMNLNDNKIGEEIWDCDEDGYTYEEPTFPKSDLQTVARYLSSTALSELHLRNSGIDDEGILLFSEGLEEGATLKVIDLMRNPKISDETKDILRKKHKNMKWRL